MSRSLLTRDKARALTDEIKSDQSLWWKLVELYECKAHVALGYSSWHLYFETEFGKSRTISYRILSQSRVMTELGATAVEPNRSQATELTPLLGRPDLLRQTWKEIVELNPKPSVADVREAVERKVGPMSHKATLNSNADKRKLHEVLSRVSGYCAALSQFNLESALQTATADDIAAWNNIASGAVRDLNILRRRVKES